MKMLLDQKQNRIYTRFGASIEAGDEEIKKLSEDQLDFILHDVGTDCYLEACPGSGKTEVIGLKAAYEIKVWAKSFCGFSILSFTKRAAAEIKSRVEKYAGARASNPPHFVGTFDSWIYNYIFIPFCTSVVDSERCSIIESNRKADFLNGFKCPTSRITSQQHCIPIYANQYYYDVLKGDYVLVNDHLRELLGHYIESDLFQSFLETNRYLTKKYIYKGFTDTKLSFHKHGFYTFEDVENRCLSYLKKDRAYASKLSRRFPIVIIDECQDLSRTQIVLLDILREAGTKLILVGDVNQSIYEFRNADPSCFLGYIESRGILKRSLKDNYRSNQSIVDCFQKIIPSDPKIEGKREKKLPESVLIWEYTTGTLQDLPRRYVEFLHGSKISREGSCILVRGNSLKDKLKKSNVVGDDCFTTLGLAIYLWKKEVKTSADIRQAIHNAGRSLSLICFHGEGDRNNFYCPSEIESLKWRRLIMDILTNINTPLYPFENARGVKYNWTKWIAKAREYFEELKSVFPERSDVIEKSKSKRAPNNIRKIEVLSSLSVVNEVDEIPITTIHDVKGQTFESVLLVSESTASSPGGYFEQWFFQDKCDEFKRIGYVATSRPKHLLVIAVPTLEPKQKKQLMEIGLLHDPELLF